jgi:hypothetical protein
VTTDYGEPSAETAETAETMKCRITELLDKIRLLKIEVTALIKELEWME